MADLSDLLAEKLDLDAPGGASSSSSSSSSSTPVPLKLTDVPNQVLVSILIVAAEDYYNWARLTVPFVCKAFRDLYRSRDASPLHEKLWLDFEAEADAAKEASSHRSPRREPVVRASRVISWARTHVESVRTLHFDPPIRSLSWRLQCNKLRSARRFRMTSLDRDHCRFGFWKAARTSFLGGAEGLCRPRSKAAQALRPGHPKRPFHERRRALAPAPRQPRGARPLGLRIRQPFDWPASFPGGFFFPLESSEPRVEQSLQDRSDPGRDLESEKTATPRCLRLRPWLTAQGVGRAHAAISTFSSHFKLSLSLFRLSPALEIVFLFLSLCVYVCSSPPPPLSELN